jgi:glycosyltransferase involved in cell wall biosynthesis
MDQKYKVAFVTIVPSPYQRDLFGALAAREDVDLNVYYMEGASPDSPWPEKPLRHFEKIMPGFWLPLGGARGHVNWKLPDLSQTHMVVLSSFTSLTGQWLMRRGLRNKSWLFWGERLHRNHGIKNFVQRGLVAPISSAAGIVGIGRAAEEDYHRRFPNLPHFCIPYHCDLSSFFAINRASLVGRSTTFFFCGQMILRKGVDLLLLAFDRLIGTGIDARLLLVGREAELPQFLAKVSPMTRTKILYEGFQPPERLPEYFAKSDIFVLPSRHDGWGVVINQALAAGLPIIVSNAVGAGVDLVAHGINGMCIPSDLNSLYGAMKTLVLNPDIGRRWGENSRASARNLTPEIGAEKWVGVFERIKRNSYNPEVTKDFRLR